MLAICQTPQLPMIIKSFVALGFVIKIDDMFSENFPKEIKDTAENLVLIIGKDQNTYKKIWKRIKKSKERNTTVNWSQAFFNVVVNLWFSFISNFYVVYYYYFAPISIILIQFIFFYYQTV